MNPSDHDSGRSGSTVSASGAVCLCFHLSPPTPPHPHPAFTKGKRLWGEEVTASVWSSTQCRWNPRGFLQGLDGVLSHKTFCLVTPGSNITRLLSSFCLFHHSIVSQGAERNKLQGILNRLTHLPIHYCAFEMFFFNSFEVIRNHDQKWLHIFQYVHKM